MTVDQANASLQSFSAGLEELYPETNERRYMSAVASGKVSLHPAVDRILTPVAGLLLAVVGVVLLIAFSARHGAATQNLFGASCSVGMPAM